MNADESRAVVARIWRAFEAGDLAIVEASLHEDFVCEWPLTRERIAGRAAYIQVNREYPGSGTIRVIRITGTAELVLSEVEAEWGEPSARVRELAVSLFEFMRARSPGSRSTGPRHTTRRRGGANASERDERTPGPERDAE